jgi:hypothetical protein
MVMLDFVTWATILGTWILVVGTLAFAYWQLRQAHQLHSSTLILDLRDRYFAPQMRVARRELSTWLVRTERGPEVDNWEVGFFFELIGFLTRTRVLDQRMVWSAFGTWIPAYYVALTQPEDLVVKWRREANDPLIFREFEWLARAMMKFEGRLAGSPRAAGYTLADAREVLEYETHLAGSGGVAGPPA